MPSAPSRRALLSVSDKTGLVEFAKRLAALGFELISTGGTGRTLREAGLTVREVTEITEFPEMLEGRVKTLHPRVHGGLLGRWSHPEHRREMETHGIVPIELVVVNLYPFERVAARAAAGEGVERGELIENIDIGGPAMLRSGAKNYESVAVVCYPADYDAVAAEIETQGTTSLVTRWRLAQAAFRHTAAYDAVIASTLSQVTSGAHDEPIRLGGEADQRGGDWPERLRLDASRLQSLRYGENPHQRAALYRNPDADGGVAQGKLLQGKELSFNNLMDLDAAWGLANEFDQTAVAIIKHTNPAGCALGASLAEAYQLALACDPVSAYGGVIGMNRELDADAAEAIASLFVECIAAPAFSTAARERLADKKNLRLLEVAPARPGWTLRSISGGFLVQEPDDRLLDDPPWRCLTRRAPTPDEAAALRFAWTVAKHVKSNAIVFARPGQTLAVGAGQMSRVDAVKVAALRAQLPLAGSAVASDAFFPFPDGIEEAARHGATAVIQPGGSVRDAEAIAVCDQLGIAMVFTGLRHFWH